MGGVIAEQKRTVGERRKWREVHALPFSHTSVAMSEAERDPRPLRARRAFFGGGPRGTCSRAVVEPRRRRSRCSHRVSRWERAYGYGANRRKVGDVRMRASRKLLRRAVRFALRGPCWARQTAYAAHSARAQISSYVLRRQARPTRPSTGVMRRPRVAHLVPLRRRAESERANSPKSFTR
jgi:hypothetical protein